MSHLDRCRHSLIVLLKNLLPPKQESDQAHFLPRDVLVNILCNVCEGTLVSGSLGKIGVSIPISFSC